ncbi:divergent PAP2 family protein [Ruminococcaceae bacterium OttesenSCG-928-O06]|nr:divergent PAP2 family protein [Ruminococcaceae bacterium OttesenSCG-928-O06]
MNMIQRLFFGNYLLMLPVLGWVIAQLAKAVIHRIVHGTFRAERLFGSGGMPSSHAALVCALFVGAAKKYGMASPYFAIAFVLAAIVMYDAMGVRLETGKQARLLNLIMDDLGDEKEEWDSEKRLKELVGHTPLQVLSGALLGVLLAILIPVF